MTLRNYNIGGFPMSKKISVIIPCYNVEQYIGRCINSLLKQTIGLNNLELIFINDASPDNTLIKLLEYEKQYPNDIIVINSEENLKQGGARNLGLNYASADFIGFVDADDWIEMTMYEKLYQKATRYDCDIVSCHYKRVSSEGTPMGSTGNKDAFYIIDNELSRKDLLLTGTGSGLGCKLYKKSLIIENNIHFPEHLAYEDNYFVHLLIMYVRKIYFLEEYLYHYYLNLQSTVVSSDSMHHFDRLTIELMKLDEFKLRGFYNIYYDEIEYNFLLLYYLNTLHIVFSRFHTVPGNLLSQMQKQVLESFPNYKDNPYLEKKLPDIYKIFLNTVNLSMQQEDWQKLADSYRKIC